MTHKIRSFHDDDCKEYYIDGRLHKRQYDDGYTSWWLNGERHREDGPAVEDPHGLSGWYLNGKQIGVSTQKEFEQYLKLMAFQ
jgi:hypothetical protein